MMGHLAGGAAVAWIACMVVSVICIVLALTTISMVFAVGAFLPQGMGLGIWAMYGRRA